MLLSLKLKENGAGRGVLVRSSDKDNIFAGTSLHAGITITEVMAGSVPPINPAKHFQDIIERHTGIASTVPSVGKLFVIQHKND